MCNSLIRMGMFENKIAYLNIMCNMSVDCDCCGVELTETNNECGYCICDKCNEELERYCKHIKDSCKVTGVYNDYRSGLTIKKIN